ncbi:hypothetical protein THIX_50074 [Thiomonas sp. X19]|nr:hypothetical protein THIX_50074 [Thiomonas sp. X19]
MANPLSFLTRLGDKAGSLGAVASAMGCAVCYPAIASIGAAVGLGFLSQWEGVLFHVVLPLSAVLVILANGLGWFAPPMASHGTRHDRPGAGADWPLQPHPRHRVSGAGGHAGRGDLGSRFARPSPLQR